MIANILNRARNITTPVQTDGDLIAGLDVALAHSGADEIAEGQVEIHCDQAFADACMPAEVPSEPETMPEAEVLAPEQGAPETESPEPSGAETEAAPIEPAAQTAAEPSPADVESDAPHPFVKSAPGSFFAYSYRGVPVLVQ